MGVPSGMTINFSGASVVNDRRAQKEKERIELARDLFYQQAANMDYRAAKTEALRRGVYQDPDVQAYLADLQEEYAHNTAVTREEQQHQLKRTREMAGDKWAIEYYGTGNTEQPGAPQPPAAAAGRGKIPQIQPTGGEDTGGLEQNMPSAIPPPQQSAQQPGETQQQPGQPPVATQQQPGLQSGATQLPKRAAARTQLPITVEEFYGGAAGNITPQEASSSNFAKSLPTRQYLDALRTKANEQAAERAKTALAARQVDVAAKKAEDASSRAEKKEDTAVIRDLRKANVDLMEKRSAILSSITATDKDVTLKAIDNHIASNSAEIAKLKYNLDDNDYPPAVLIEGVQFDVYQPPQIETELKERAKKLLEENQTAPALTAKEREHLSKLAMDNAISGALTESYPYLFDILKVLYDFQNRIGNKQRIPKPAASAAGRLSHPADTTAQDTTAQDTVGSLFPLKGQQ